MECETYPAIRNLDGVYVRVERDQKYHNLSFSDLAEDEQDNFLCRLDKGGLQRMCKLLANELRTIGDELDVVRCEHEHDLESGSRVKNGTDMLVPNPTASKTEVKLAPDFGRRLLYRGQGYLLVGAAGRKSFFDNAFCVPVNYSSEQIKKACVRIYRGLARKDFTIMVQKHAEEMDLEPLELKLNSARKTLSSISSAKNTINLSWLLIMADDKVIEYTIISVMARLKSLKEHPLDYLSIIKCALPNHKELQKKLREFKKMLLTDDWLDIGSSVDDLGLSCVNHPSLK